MKQLKVIELKMQNTAQIQQTIEDQKKEVVTRHSVLKSGTYSKEEVKTTSKSKTSDYLRWKQLSKSDSYYRLRSIKPFNYESLSAHNYTIHEDMTQMLTAMKFNVSYADCRNNFNRFKGCAAQTYIYKDFQEDRLKAFQRINGNLSYLKQMEDFQFKKKFENPQDELYFLNRYKRCHDELMALVVILELNITDKTAVKERVHEIKALEQQFTKQKAQLTTVTKDEPNVKLDSEQIIVDLKALIKSKNQDYDLMRQSKRSDLQKAVREKILTSEVYEAYNKIQREYLTIAKYNSVNLDKEQTSFQGVIGKKVGDLKKATENRLAIVDRTSRNEVKPEKVLEELNINDFKSIAETEEAIFETKIDVIQDYITKFNDKYEIKMKNAIDTKSFHEINSKSTFDDFKIYSKEICEYFDLCVTKAQCFSVLLLPEEPTEVPAMLNQTFLVLYQQSKNDDIIFHEKSQFKWMEKHLKDSKTWLTSSASETSSLKYGIRKYFRVAYLSMELGMIPFDLLADEKRRKEYVDQMVSCSKEKVYYNIFRKGQQASKQELEDFKNFDAMCTSMLSRAKDSLN